MVRRSPYILHDFVEVDLYHSYAYYYSLPMNDIYCTYFNKCLKISQEKNILKVAKICECVRTYVRICMYDAHTYVLTH